MDEEVGGGGGKVVVVDVDVFVNCCA